MRSEKLLPHAMTYRVAVNVPVQEVFGCNLDVRTNSRLRFFMISSEHLFG